MHFEGKAVSLINGEYFNKLLMFLLFGSDCTRTFSGTLCYRMKQRRFNFLSFILLHVCPARVMISWVNWIQLGFCVLHSVYALSLLFLPPLQISRKAVTSMFALRELGDI